MNEGLRGLENPYYLLFVMGRIRDFRYLFYSVYGSNMRCSNDWGVAAFIAVYDNSHSHGWYHTCHICNLEILSFNLTIWMLGSDKNLPRYGHLKIDIFMDILGGHHQLWGQAMNPFGYLEPDPAGWSWTGSCGEFWRRICGISDPVGSFFCRTVP